MKKFKRCIGVLLAMIMLFTTGVGAIAEDRYWQLPQVGIIISTRVSGRLQPSVNGEWVGYLQNAEEIEITGENGQFYIVSTRGTSLEKKGSQCYVRKQFVCVPGTYVILQEETTIWATPSGNVANASKSAGTKLILIEETDSYYAVQICDNTAGTGFILKDKVDNPYWNTGNSFVPNAYSGKGLITGGSVAVYPSTDDSDLDYAIHFAHQGDVFELAGYPVPGVKEELQPIYFEYLGQKVICYVHSQYVMSIVD